MTNSLWRQGFTKVTLKHVDRSITMRSEDFESLYEAWQKGVTFAKYTGLYGNSVGIKFAEVAVISLSTPESIIREESDDDFDEARRKAKELTNG